MRAAAAKVVRKRLSNLGVGRLFIGGEEGRGFHDHAVDAIAALRRAEIGERGLQRMKFGAVRQPLDRLDAATLAFEREHQA